MVMDRISRLHRFRCRYRVRQILPQVFNSQHEHIPFHTWLNITDKHPSTLATHTLARRSQRAAAELVLPMLMRVGRGVHRSSVGEYRAHTGVGERGAHVRERRARVVRVSGGVRGLGSRVGEDGVVVVPQAHTVVAVVGVIGMH